MIEWFLTLSPALQFAVSFPVAFVAYAVAGSTYWWVTNAGTSFSDEEYIPSPTLMVYDEPPADW